MATTGDWLSVIYEISKVINASLELPEIIRLIARETRRFIHFDFFSVGLEESGGQHLRLFVPVAPDGVQDLDGTTVALEGTLLGHAVRIGEPVLLPDLRAAEDVPGVGELVEEGMASAVALPLVSGAKVLGAFAAARSAPRPFEETEVDMFREVAEQTAMAVDHARLYEAEKKRASHLAIINELASRVLSTFDLDALLQQAALLIQQRFDYYDVGIFLTDAATDEVVLRAQSGAYVGESAVGYRQTVGVGMVGWCAETGQSLLASDVRKNPHYIVAFDGERSARAELCVPIQIGGEVAGVINVESAQVGAFDETDVMALETLSDQVAQAIENVRL
ncbi:MAG: GAF domain-containing protein, partial [Planctomycetota bacterium]